MQTFLELIKAAVGSGADELFLLAGQPAMFKTGVSYRAVNETVLTPNDTARYVNQAYEMSKRQVTVLDKNRDDQFAVSLPGISRIRITAYFQRNSYALTARIIPFAIPEPETIQIPDTVMALSERKEGLVLICGPSASGKTTTAACLINAINKNRCCHILTLENPIEYLFRNQCAFVSQRELLLDTADLPAGLRAARWLSPDVLFISDLNCGTAFREVLEKAEGGCLVIGVMNAGNPATAVLSALQYFTGEEREQTARLFGSVLRAIVFEKLIPDAGGRRPEFRLIEPDGHLRGTLCSGSAEEIRRAFA